MLLLLLGIRSSVPVKSKVAMTVGEDEHGNQVEADMADDGITCASYSCGEDSDEGEKNEVGATPESP
eukprot:712236-Hanusia_phi.AAC.4